MAKLYISEAAQLYASPTATSQSPLPFFPEPATAEQVITFTTAQQSAAFTGRIVRLIADADCHILFDANPTAVATSPLYKANIEYFRAVVPGQKLSVYDGIS